MEKQTAIERLRGLLDSYKNSAPKIVRLLTPAINSAIIEAAEGGWLAYEEGVTFSWNKHREVTLNWKTQKYQSFKDYKPNIKLLK